MKEASGLESGDGIPAWKALRQAEEYGDARRRYGAAGAAHLLEPGPFPIRIQTEAALEAGRFELLAWENPWKADGPASPFRRRNGMVEGLPEPGAQPPVETVGDGGSVDGLRARR